MNVSETKGGTGQTSGISSSFVRGLSLDMSSRTSHELSEEYSMAIGEREWRWAFFLLPLYIAHTGPGRSSDVGGDADKRAVEGD